MSIMVHLCDDAQRTKDQKGKRSNTHYVQSHRDRTEKRNYPIDSLGLYLVALNIQAIQKNLRHHKILIA